jgi:Mg2+ and Co2+ transporter CorA
MAVTSIKDNTTMKTLAVIAAVFLPGTYIAVC